MLEQSEGTGFGRHASAYQQTRPGYPPSVYQAFERLASSPPGGAVLEIGAGTGQPDSSPVDIAFWRWNQITNWLLAPRINCKSSAIAWRFASPDSKTFLSSPRASTSSWPRPPWHWIQPERGLHLAAQALRPSGSLFLLWNAHIDEWETPSG